ncbi:MAG: universal stress protein [Pseudomonadota bacterium]
MTGVKKILATIDFSGYSQATLRAALEMSREVGAALAVLNVLNQRDVEAVRNAVKYGQTGGLDEQGFIARQSQERREMIARLLAECGGDPAAAEVAVRVGVPAQEILEAVREMKADLVVMGTKGRTNLAMSLFGSTAERVYRRCPVTVLSVRGPEHAGLVGKLAS